MLKLLERQPKFWYKKNFFSLSLLPLAYVYCAIIFLRKFFYKIKIFESAKPPIPVIIVGNLTVGGTGKTPLVIKLTEFLQQKGYRPGIVSRGYIPKFNIIGEKKKFSKAILEVSSSSDPEEVGDEALLIVRETKSPMAVAKKRLLAAQLLHQKYHCDVIISDDGLQHYALQRDVEIVVIDEERGFGNGFCLPAGPMREKTADCNILILL